MKKYKKTSLSRIIYRSFWNCYDHPGVLILFNLFSLGLMMSIIGLPLALVGLNFVAARIVDYQDVQVRDFRRSFKVYGKRGIFLVVLFVFISILLISNLVFYFLFLNSFSHTGFKGLLFIGMFGLMIWLSILFMIFTFYAFPLLIHLNLGLKETLKNSFFLMLDNLKVSVFLFLNFWFWLLFGLLTGVVLFILSFSIIAVVSHTAVRELLGQYQSRPWDEHEEVRGWNDIFRPWHQS